MAFQPIGDVRAEIADAEQEILIGFDPDCRESLSIQREQPRGILILIPGTIKLFALAKTLPKHWIGIPFGILPNRAFLYKIVSLSRNPLCCFVFASLGSIFRQRTDVLK